MNKELIPFNEWSRERIRQGKKICTSRHKKYLHDPRVTHIIEHSWGTIKAMYWQLEGADNPVELQKVIENIYKRKVPDNERFYVHFGNFKPQTQSNPEKPEVCPECKGDKIFWDDDKQMDYPCPNCYGSGKPSQEQ